jgi:hypothetical protein
MSENDFISPTMKHLYDADPNWTSDSEKLYKLGFSKRTMVDVHGFDVRGFNADEVDRLGCTAADYADPVIAEIAGMAGDKFSLSHKLSTPLPRFLTLRPVFERLVGQKWDTVPGWTVGFDNLPNDGKKRLFYDLGQEMVIGLHWFDELDGRHSYLMVRSDVIAALGHDLSYGGVPFRLASISSASRYELVEDVRFAPDAAHARAIISEHIEKHLQPIRSWTILLQDTADGPAVGAYSAAELATVEGDVIMSSVMSRTPEEALQSVMDNSKSSALSMMAARGIQAIVGHPALYRDPRPL